MVKNPNVDRIIDFISKFSVSLSTSSSSKEEEEEEENRTRGENTTCGEIENPFLLKLINYLIGVRKREREREREREINSY
jgi:hypothetical protein